MKFVHTADWQIGMRATQLGEAAPRAREARLTAAARVVTSACESGADFIVLAGDTFEHNGVDRVLVQKVVDILDAFGGPVYVIPGNHDPVLPGAVWEHPGWTASGRLNVLREPAAVRLDACEVLPCPVRDPHSRRDPTAWIPQARAGHVRIGIAHGTVQGIADDPVCPIGRDAAQRLGLDYLALGHWHSYAEYRGDDGSVRMAYSGTHEPTKFGERDSGKALLVDIAGPGVAPAIRPIDTARLRWVSLAEEIRSPGELGEVAAGIERIDDPGSTVLQVSISGVLFPDDAVHLTRLREIVAARPFVFARVDEAALFPVPGDDSWLQRLPEGIVRDAAARLRELANPAYSGVRPDGASAEVAARALIELCALAPEVHP